MLEILLREDQGPCTVNEASCRKWRIAVKSEAQFTRGVCPDGMARIYPEVDTET